MVQQQTGSKSIKEYVKAVYPHPYFTYVQSALCEMLDWMKHKLESRLLGKITITLDMQYPYDKKQSRTKEPPEKSE